MNKQNCIYLGHDIETAFPMSRLKLQEIRRNLGEIAKLDGVLFLVCSGLGNNQQYKHHSEVLGYGCYLWRAGPAGESGGA
jgi:hypothetical protein